ncbi:MAG: DUF2911 domain-containing protein [Gemmatimonadaceae bacterium]
MYARMSMVVTFAVAAMGLTQPACSTPVPDSATLVTTLGRDTVVMESFTRSPMQLEGHVVVRFPGTVLIHYVLDLDKSGAPTSSLVDLTPMGTSDVFARRVRIDFRHDSAFVDVDSVGHHKRGSIALPAGAFPSLVTGFGPSYGLYESPEFFTLYKPLATAQAGDTVHLTTIDLASWALSRRAFVKPSATQLDADFFRIAFAHVTLDGSGRVMKVDARQTTERTETKRSDYTDIAGLAQRFASEDRSGKGLGAASPSVSERGKVGGAPVVVSYSSPRLRGRTVLGSVVPYAEVWRTGANAATTLSSEKSLAIGGKIIPAGVYSVWTLPNSNGGVDLIINSQHGQWGTDYDGSHDITKIPMQVTTVPSPREDFIISISDTAPQSLSIAWDRFVWSVPIALAK